MAMELAQGIVLVSALGVPFAMAEMAYSHHRGNFHRVPMYTPVILPPLFVVSALVYLLMPTGATSWAFGAMGVLLVLMGLAGSFFHLQGVARQTGGFNLDNVMVGPPLVAPLSFSLLGMLGLMALLLGGG